MDRELASAADDADERVEGSDFLCG
jgi:hypothetical protein